MSHDPANFELVSEPPASVEKGRAGVVGSGALFGIRISDIPKAKANGFVSARHYSRSSVWSSHTHFGVFVGDAVEPIGVLQFGPSMNPRATSNIIPGLAPRAVVELNRMVFAEPHYKNLPTWSISAAISLLKERRPELQVVQSFADSRCKKLGAVYQAANFIFLGQHRSAFYFLDGEWFHKSLLGRAAVDKRGWGSGPKAARLAAGRERAIKHEFDQYRYVFPVTKWARRRLLPRALTYPKPALAAIAA